MLPFDVFRKGMVVNQSGIIRFFNTIHNEEVGNVDVGHEMRYGAASPNGRFAYVAGTTGGTQQTRVSKIDFRTLAITGSLDFVANGPIGELEISPDGRMLVVGSPTVPTLYFIDPQTMTLVDTVTFPGSNLVTPEVTFDSNSQYAYATAQGGIVTIDPSTRQVLHSSPLPLGAVYTDIETLDNVPNLVFATWSLSFDVHQSLAPGSAPLVGFPFSRDLAMFTFTAEHFVAYGGSGATAGLHMRHINSATTVDIPSTSTIVQSLRFNPIRLEVWAVQPGSTFSNLRYSVFDLVNLNERGAIPGVPVPPFSPAGTGIPALSQDGAFFYHPVPTSDKLVVIDTELLTQTSFTSSGTPIVVVMQGDVSTREAY